MRDHSLSCQLWSDQRKTEQHIRARGRNFVTIPSDPPSKEMQKDVNIVPSDPPSKEMQKDVNIVQTDNGTVPSPNPSPLVAAETSGQPRTRSGRQKRLLPPDDSPVAAKKPAVTVTETIDPPNEDDEDVDDGDVSNSAYASPLPMDSLDGETSGMLNMGSSAVPTTETDRPEMTISDEEDDSCQNVQEHQEMPSENIFLNCNSTVSHQPPNPHPIVEDEREYSKKNCEELSSKLKHLEETAGEQEKKETSHQEMQSFSNGDLHSSELDDRAMQLDDVLQRLESCSAERDQFKTQIEQLQKENMQLKAQNDQLKMEVQQLKESTNERASTSMLGN